MVASFYSTPAPALSIGDYTVSTLPDASLYAKRLAWVTDLHDTQPDYVMSDGTRWKETNSDSASIIANGNTNLTFNPFVNAPIQIIQGTLTAQRTCTINTTLAYPGQTFTIKREAGGLFNLVVNTIGVGLNSWADFVYNGTAFVQARSGGLL